MKETNHSVVIVAGGSGSRMGGDIPKQYMEVNGKPVLAWTIEKFLAFDPHIRLVLVLGDGHEGDWENLYERFLKNSTYFKKTMFAMVTGGLTRFDSVRSGLEVIEKDGIVGIHDAVRPMVSPETIRRCYEMAERHGSAIPVTEVEDTIRLGDNDKNRQIDREQLKRVQTPQVFRAAEIKSAYLQTCQPAFTDDASVYEAMFGRVWLVQGNPENIKITKPSDLKFASALLV